MKNLLIVLALVIGFTFTVMLNQKIAVQKKKVKLLKLKKAQVLIRQ